jgi:hypothetical protein
MLQVKHVLADKGYDSLPVYQQVRELGAFPLIQFIHHAENPPEGMDEHFRPLCQKATLTDMTASIRNTKH